MKKRKTTFRGRGHCCPPQCSMARVCRQGWSLAAPRGSLGRKRVGMHALSVAPRPVSPSSWPLLSLLLPSASHPITLLRNRQSWEHWTYLNHHGHSVPSSPEGYYCPHFSDRETEAERVYSPAQSHVTCTCSNRIYVKSSHLQAWCAKSVHPYNPA